MNHKIVNSYSEEADLYAHFFEDINGDRLSKKFDCDIKHKVFFCTHCNLEIEKKTLFSYNKVKKQLERLRKKAERKKTKLDIVYLYDSDSKDQNFINIDTIIAKFSNQKGEFEKIIFLAEKRQKYEQAKYFEPTTDLKKCFRLVWWNVISFFKSFLKEKSPCGFSFFAFPCKISWLFSILAV